MIGDYLSEDILAGFEPRIGLREQGQALMIGWLAGVAGTASDHWVRIAGKVLTPTA